jgi:hypothetical protein
MEEESRTMRNLRNQRGIATVGIALALVAVFAIGFAVGFLTQPTSFTIAGSGANGYTTEVFPTTVTPGGPSVCAWVNSSHWDDKFCISITLFNAPSNAYSLTGTYAHQNSTGTTTLGPIYQVQGASGPATVWVSPSGHGFLSWIGSNLDYPTIGAGN